MTAKRIPKEIMDKMMNVRIKPTIDANMNLKNSFIMSDIKTKQRYINDAKKKCCYFEPGNEKFLIIDEYSG